MSITNFLAIHLFQNNEIFNILGAFNCLINVFKCYVCAINRVYESEREQCVILTFVLNAETWNNRMNVGNGLILTFIFISNAWKCGFPEFSWIIEKLSWWYLKILCTPNCLWNWCTNTNYISIEFLAVIQFNLLAHIFIFQFNRQIAIMVFTLSLRSAWCVFV